MVEFSIENLAEGPFLCLGIRQEMIGKFEKANLKTSECINTEYNFSWGPMGYARTFFQSILDSIYQDGKYLN